MRISFQFLDPLIMKTILWLFLLLSVTFFAQDEKVIYSDLDVELLNDYILKEVNLLRKKAKVKPLKNELLLQPAANNQASFMQENNKLTHFQKRKDKRTPKNRVDYFGGQFNVVGENVQQIHKDSKVKIKRKERAIDSYSELAKLLVYNWEHSPPHYRNIITPNYKTTFTTIKIGKDGKIYACQLFGGSVYEKPPELVNGHEYKAYKEKKCKRCYSRPFKASVHVTKDSVIYLIAERKKDVKKLFRSRNKDGVVADVVLKEQFECGKDNQVNGREGVTGFLLEPVFKKDFNKDGNFYRKKYVRINLGKVPTWVDQEFEVNLTLINKNRTCRNIHYYEFRTEMHLDLNLGINLDSLSPLYTETKEDSLVQVVYYNKGKSAISDASLLAIKSELSSKNISIETITIEGFSSIEGSLSYNKSLYNKRANNLLELLDLNNIDSSKIHITAEENFNGFRKDIKNTSYEYIGSLSDSELKEKMKDTSLTKALEIYLKKHRFSKLTINYKEKSNHFFSLKEVKKDLQLAVNKERKKEAIQLQKVKYWYFLKDSLSLNDTIIDIPFNKDNLELLLNKSVLKFNLDSLNPNSYFNFENDLNQLLVLDAKNKKVNTILAAFDFLNMMNSTTNESIKFFSDLKKRKYLDAKLKARLLIATAYYNDVVLYKRNNKNILLPKIKKYLRPAKLKTNEKFDVARYYSFYYDYKSAYNISRKLIGKTEELNDWVYFLKLIHFSNIKEKRKLYINYFKKIKRYSGDRFCQLFHSPKLNFQILSDEEIKSIYCKSCENHD